MILQAAQPRTPEAPAKPLRILFALPGLHRVVRGAEVAFESVAREIARTPGYSVTLIGSGQPRPDEPSSNQTIQPAQWGNPLRLFHSD